MTALQDLHFYGAKLKNLVLPSLKFRDEVWTIQIWTGVSPFDLRSADAGLKPVIAADSVSDMEAAFVADPFLVYEGGRWYMFFEALERPENQGVICLACSDDGYNWSYAGTVLREGFHLSYPYTFKWNDEYYMIPESAQAGGVRLYKCTSFPNQWSFVGILVTGAHRDPSIFRFDGLWWMFSETGAGKGGTLRLHYAHDLIRDWIEHPKSPLIVDNPHITRPGGRVLEYGGRKFRIAQDNFPEYGTQLFAFQILELTTRSYREERVGNGPILKGRGSGAFRERIHHLDAHEVREGEWIAAIDHSRRKWNFGLRRSLPRVVKDPGSMSH